MRVIMTGSDIGFVVLVVAALTIFGGVLGWASWPETRAWKEKEKHRKGIK
jgi:hypothetical protein